MVMDRHIALTSGMYGAMGCCMRGGVLFRARAQTGIQIINWLMVKSLLKLHHSLSNPLMSGGGWW